MKKVAFNTANLVAQVTDWKFSLSRWGHQDRLTRDATDERAWADICRQIAAAGYRAVEIWVAHLDPPTLSDAKAKVFARILSDNGLTPIGLAGPLTTETTRVCDQLQIPACNGGLWGTDAATVARLIAEGKVGFNYENHPEKNVDDIRTQAEACGADAGVALDTGWLGTQGVDAASAIRDLGSLIHHVHLKDVSSAGSHHTCPLGTGIVNIEAAIQALKQSGYDGWYSWEDEPEDRNPMLIARDMRLWIEERI